MGQTWNDLLFAHYRVPVESLRAHVPEGLQLEEHSGSGWLGVTPFAITGLRARGLPAFPLVSAFRELNVRTYVTRDGKPGIWFLSLDASSRLAVEAARLLYRLPYFRADITCKSAGGRVDYECRRDENTIFSGSYEPTGPPAVAAHGSLEHFLTERYCLYAEHDGTLYRADIHHRPWPLQPAEAELEWNTMPPADVGLDGEPVLHFVKRQDVVIWPLRSL